MQIIRTDVPQSLFPLPFTKRAPGTILAPSGTELVVAEWTASGTPSGETPEFIAPRHVHHQDDEAWYVLEGTLGFHIGDANLQANAGSAVMAPRGTVHTFWNPKPSPARCLIIMTARIRALVDAIHATDKRDPETMKKLFEHRTSPSSYMAVGRPKPEQLRNTCASLLHSVRRFDMLADALLIRHLEGVFQWPYNRIQTMRKNGRSLKILEN